MEHLSIWWGGDRGKSCLFNEVCERWAEFLYVYLHEYIMLPWYLVNGIQASQKQMQKESPIVVTGSLYDKEEGKFCLFSTKAIYIILQNSMEFPEH